MFCTRFKLVWLKVVVFSSTKCEQARTFMIVLDFLITFSENSSQNCSLSQGHDSRAKTRGGGRHEPHGSLLDRVSYVFEDVRYTQTEGMTSFTTALFTNHESVSGEQLLRMQLSFEPWQTDPSPLPPKCGILGTTLLAPFFEKLLNVRMSVSPSAGRLKIDDDLFPCLRDRGHVRTLAQAPKREETAPSSVLKSHRPLDIRRGDYDLCLPSVLVAGGAQLHEGHVHIVRELPLICSRQGKRERHND